ncbi:MAG: cupin fold metalloprotein, WbuC family [Candidatus Omnitrophica bacterium]|nr:cupin fold metalloprotein, WbuC family [Candidatus Omnitrophota bacterium]
MKKITRDLTGEVLDKAKKASRKRCNYNFHSDHSDPINRMLNAVEPEAYFPPHKHEDPPKREVFIILKGRALFLEFTDKGDLADHVLLDPVKGAYGVEVAPAKWHSLIPLESSVLYEIKDGPYEEHRDKIFADWAPRENGPGINEYVNRIKKEVLGEDNKSPIR